jgi:hypothetical protein
VKKIMFGPKMPKEMEQEVINIKKNLKINHGM